MIALHRHTLKQQQMKAPKRTPTDPESLRRGSKSTKIETDLPLSEKDEVKKAEEKLRKNQKKQDK